MIVYAATTDLPAWVDATPDNAVGLLMRASIVVARATNRDPYNDTPTTGDALALKDATCAQVAGWVANGIDPDAAGLDSAPVKKTSMLGADVELDTAGLNAARVGAAADLTPLAYDILLQAGLLWQPVPVGADSMDRLPRWGMGRQWWPYPEPMSGQREWPWLWP